MPTIPRNPPTLYKKSAVFKGPDSTVEISVCTLPMVAVKDYIAHPFGCKYNVHGVVSSFSAASAAVNIKGILLKSESCVYVAAHPRWWHLGPHCPPIPLQAQPPWRMKERGDIFA